MASNPSSGAGNPASSSVPGLSQEILSLRRPLNTNVYYSCTQQEWDNLCRQTLNQHTEFKATAVLLKKHRAGKLHETNEGEVAQIRCTACTKGGNGAGHPCYLPANSSTKTCAHCSYTNKSKCDAQRVPAGSNNPVAIAPFTSAHQPVPVTSYGSPAFADTPVAAPSSAPYYTTPMPSAPAQYPPVPTDPLLLGFSPQMTEEEQEAFLDRSMDQMTRNLRRDQGEDQC